MTPKEKASELIEKFKINDYDWIAQGNFYCVKQHALITVDEVLNTIFNEDFSGHLLDEIGALDYWREVKNEIEAMNGYN
jgi:phosphatidate phosphatase PAH1